MDQEERTEQTPSNAPELPQRLIGRPWVKGQSGNPSGRPKGLIRAIRRRTKDGVLLAQFLTEVLLDKEADLKCRLEAARLLCERGFAKPDYEQAPDGPVNIKVVYSDSGLDYDTFHQGFQRAIMEQSSQRLELQQAEKNKDGCLLDITPAQ